ncbi:helix-turn-helix domain-containing protein [Klebsiella pneumoniae]|jgi:transcriptional regulator with XRE-family HTH domain|uniref:Helix-turn-helix transcriptional regulator n=1 Tax=Citrobacter werkmanii TaxID=67827 RepID=A0AA37ZDK0_9ENTR|nr:MULTISPECIES: helix-turn-helix transcriptional regulator [Klebsiella]HAT7593437.1 helix-turn-helix transcriptional regulator [Citrobacter werkmanii]HBC8671390.1 helix-turn-helix transcriptional regulator [Klebsiella oxytoca]MBZ2036138.1 helix-turn-helix transcriptional regulator [Klebsiella pneumoniae]HBR4917954.1 helix-turn-helix transcriptional regulator [Klebsiella pneumoniae]HCB9346886.1 helix-turn-helix transcriptional regulator [Klebsiella pneumoniae]
MNTSNHYNDIFCRRLKQARLASGLSQKRLGIAAGIDEFVASTRINRYEKGVHEPGTEIVQKLAEVLRVPLAYFYAEDDDLAELMLAFLSLSKQERIEVISHVRKKINE